MKQPREFAEECLLRGPEGSAMLKAEVVYTVLGKNKWSLTKSDKQKSTNVNIQVSNELAHGIQKAKTKCHTSYVAHYLENGKFVAIEKKDRAELNNGHVEVVGVSRSSLEVDMSGRLTWLQRCEETLMGLVVTFTTRGERAQGGRDHFDVFLRGAI